MKLNRKQLRRIIQEAYKGPQTPPSLSGMTRSEAGGGAAAVKSYIHGLPHEPDRVSQGPSHDHNLGDYNIGNELDNTVYGDDDMDRDRFDSEVQAALNKLVAAGVLGRSSEGYYVADGDIIKDGHIDLTDY